MTIPSEPIVSIPRPRSLIQAVNSRGYGIDPSLDGLYEEATRAPPSLRGLLRVASGI